MAEHQHSEKHEAHRKLVGRLREMAGDVRRITAGLDEASLAKRTVADKREQCVSQQSRTNQKVRMEPIPRLPPILRASFPFELSHRVSSLFSTRLTLVGRVLSRPKTKER